MQTLAEKIIFSIKTDLYLNMKFFHVALGKLNTTDEKRNNFNNNSISTDGDNLFYNTEWLIEGFKDDKELLNRTFVHTLLHCIYQHIFLNSYFLNETVYNLACDILIESMIDDLKLSFLQRSNLETRLEIYKNFLNKHDILLLHELYNQLLEKDEKEIKYLIKIFELDDHKMWPRNKKFNSNQSSNSDSKQKKKKDSEQEKDQENQSENYSNSLNEQRLKTEWQDIAGQVAIDLDKFGKEMGTQSANFEKGLKIISREKYDLKDVVRRFLQLKEIYKEDLESFDPIYYTYGLVELDNHPLIEYLEYKEEKVIDELVILIDTSGSTFSSEVIKFLEIVYEIVIKNSPKSNPFKLYIAQIDSELKVYDLIYNIDQFNAYMDKFVLKGGGGTSFVPGIDFVNKLIDEKKLNRLKGVIYFTDGFGQFPKLKPKYDVMFAFFEGKSNINNYDIPVWSSKVIITEGDLYEYSSSKK